MEKWFVNLSLSATLLKLAAVVSLSLFCSLQSHPRIHDKRAQSGSAAPSLAHSFHSKVNCVINKIFITIACPKHHEQKHKNLIYFNREKHKRRREIIAPKTISRVCLTVVASGKTREREKRKNNFLFILFPIDGKVFICGMKIAPNFYFFSRSPSSSSSSASSQCPSIELCERRHNTFDQLLAMAIKVRNFGNKKKSVLFYWCTFFARVKKSRPRKRFHGQ